jgi:hypothetical protein
VVDAAEATTTSGGFKLTIDGRYSILGRQVPMKGSGEIDPAARRGHLRFDQIGPLGSANGGGVEQIFAGDVIYMKTPAVAQQFGVDKEWLRVDLQSAGRALGIDPTQLGQVGSNDPRQMLDQIRSVSGEVEKVGTEKVRGVETTRYRADVDLRRYPDRLPKAQQEQARVAVEKIVDMTGSDTYPMTLWIDDDELVRRVRTDYRFRRSEGERESSVTLTMEFFDFGTQVKVQPPPAKDVQDLTDLARRATDAPGAAQPGGAPGSTP